MSLRGIRRFGSLAVPLTVFALSACGGGGNSTPSVLPTASPAASPAATATPAPNATASGDAFAYTGSITQTFTVYGTPAPPPVPPATPEPTATPWVSAISQKVTQNVTLATGQSFNGQTGLTDFTSKETDAGQLQTTTVTSQAYVSYAPDSARANGVDVTEIGTSSTDSNGVSLQSVLGTGNGIITKLPSIPGAQWTNGATRTDTEKDPDGQTTSATYAADGSYQEQIAYPQNGTATVVTYPDGSGNYGFPLIGNPGNQSYITIGAPAGGQIQLTYTLLPGAGLPQGGAFTLPVWYPQASTVLASDTYVDEGSTTLPSSCNVGSAYQSVTVEKIVETKNRLDTVFGEYETDQSTQYASPSYGLLCTVASDDLQTYYDYSGQAGALVNWSPTPLRDTAVTETLALQSAQLATSATTHRGAQNSVVHVSPQPSLARAHMVLEAIHAQHVHALYARAHSLSRTRQQK